ncbi:unnamed protein product [Meloidogyne enterolobii]|uniref:Uncharacterized protein n=1 Tax=Meloidogyne enterolobii TaxID=390850 RepID=A0ACB0XNM8_MELEN
MLLLMMIFLHLLPSQLFLKVLMLPLYLTLLQLDKLQKGDSQKSLKVQRDGRKDMMNTMKQN